MSSFLYDCFFSEWSPTLNSIFSDMSVDYVPTYTNDYLEPLYIVSKYPIFLINWMHNMGIGRSTCMPGFGVKTALETVIALIEDPDAKLTIYPEDPQGCDIVNKNDLVGFIDAENVKIRVRATYSVEIVGGKTFLSIDSAPFEVNPTKIVDTIIDMYKDGKLPEIVNADGNSLDHGESFNILVEIKKGYDPASVMTKLYKATQLEKTFSTRYSFVDEFENCDFTCRIAVLEWIRYRRETLKRLHKIKLSDICKRIHVLTGILDMMDNNRVDEVISIIRTNKRMIAHGKLMSRIGLTDYQADKILDMRLSQLSEDNYQEFKNEIADLTEKAIKVKKLTKDNKKIDKIIIDDMREGIKKYGKPRQSKVYQLIDGIRNIPNTDHYLIFTNKYVKKINYSPEGYKIGRIDDGDKIKKIIYVNNRDMITLFDKSGRAYTIAVNDIGNSDTRSIGIALSQFKIQDIFVDALVSDDKFKGILVSVSDNGMVSATNYQDIYDIKTSKICMKFGKDDGLAGITLSKMGDDIIVYTGGGNATLFKTDEFGTTQLGTKGVMAIKVDNVNKVAGVSNITKDDTMLLIATDRAYMKHFPIKTLPKASRNTNGIEINSGNGSVVSVVPYNDNCELLFGYTNAQAFEFDPTKISTKSRLGKNERVAELPNTVYLFDVRK